MKRKSVWKSGSLALCVLCGSLALAHTAIAQDADLASPDEEIETITPEEEDSPSGSSLLDITRAVSGLIPPLDKASETNRALNASGRSDPFVPVADSSAPLRPTRIPLPELPGGNPSSEPTEIAGSIEVSGIVKIGNDTFALLSASGSVPEMVQAGERYETALVSSISVTSREVVLEEGGQRFVKSVPQ